MQTFFLNDPASWLVWVPFWALVALVIIKRGPILNWMEQVFEGDQEDDELP